MRLHRRKLAITIFIGILAIAAFWFLLRPSPEPSYNGKSVSQWLDFYTTPLPDGSNWTNAEQRRKVAGDAIRNIGTNAIPVLLKKLNATDSRLKRFILARSSPRSAARFGISVEAYGRYAERSANEVLHAHIGFRLLGPAAKPAVPGLVIALRDSTNLLVRYTAAESLGFIGPAAQPALLPLVNTLGDHRSDMPDLIREAIFNIAFDKAIDKWRPETIPILVPALTETLKNPNADAIAILRILSGLGPSALPAVPAILPFVNSSDPEISAAARGALEKIDPANPALK